MQKKTQDEKTASFDSNVAHFLSLPESREPKRHREKPQPGLDAHGRHLRYKYAGRCALGGAAEPL